MRSELSIYHCGSGEIRTLFRTDQAPNWSPDGSFLIFNGGGRLYRLDLVDGAEPQPIDTGFARACNNDHGISPDGSMLVISDSTETGKSCIYTLPISGGMPRRVTLNVPSWWHGWSPDGETLAFVGARAGAFNIYTVPAGRGEETRLTDGAAHHDGPDYTPDGEWIWFNSDRAGTMQLWRMRPDGSDLRQMSDDGRVNWFPHPSPDGTKVLYLSYEAGVTGHPRDREVELRLMSPAGGEVRRAVALFGGQGSINVPCWSPDGSAFAFVQYGRQ